MMTKRDELLALAERCEKATGPDRRLDCEIEAAIGKLRGDKFIVVGQPTYDPERYFSHQEGMNWIGYDLLNVGPCHTASLDAAMTLVPEGWALTLRETTQGDQNSHTGDSWLPEWNAALIRHGHTGYKIDQRGHWWHGNGATPALALCAASLRARAEEVER